MYLLLLCCYLVIIDTAGKFSKHAGFLTHTPVRFVFVSQRSCFSSFHLKLYILLNHEVIGHLMKSCSTVRCNRNKYCLTISTLGGGYVCSKCITFALYFNWALYTTVCIATLIKVCPAECSE